MGVGEVGGAVKVATAEVAAEMAAGGGCAVEMGFEWWRVEFVCGGGWW